MKLPNLKHAATVLACVGLGATLAGCEGLGDGNKPTEVFIAQTPTRQGAALVRLSDDEPLETTQCQPRSVSAFGVFESGGTGNFTNRVTWASSDESVFEISNGDIFVPAFPDTPLPEGTLIPNAEGTAMLTATFSTLSVTVPITVQGLDSVTLTPADAMTALGSSRQYTLTGTAADGAEIDLTFASTWSISNDDDDVDVNDVARIGSGTGVFGGDAAGEVSITADVNACEFAATTTTTVATPELLDFRKEFDDRTQLIAGTSEAFSLFAVFADDSEQDITTLPPGALGEVTVVAEDATQGQFVFNGAPDIYQSIDVGDGTTDLFARFDPTPDAAEEGEDFSPATLTSNTITLELVDGDLTDLEITPADITLGPLESQQYVATGTFDNTLTQDISRHVRWASSDQDIAFVTNLQPFAGGANGLAFSSQVGGTVDITATCRVAADGEELNTLTVCGGGREEIVGTGTLTVDAPPAEDSGDDSGS